VLSADKKVVKIWDRNDVCYNIISTFVVILIFLVSPLLISHL
jgi:hypothetical protein